MKLDPGSGAVGTLVREWRTTGYTATIFTWHQDQRCFRHFKTQLQLKMVTNRRSSATCTHICPVKGKEDFSLAVVDNLAVKVKNRE